MASPDLNLKSIPCQFVRGTTGRTVVVKWQATVATVYVNEMKAIFYSTIRAFGRREAELITPKRLGFANAIRFQNYLILNQRRDFGRNSLISSFQLRPPS